jgi:hypothetical protein
MREVEIRFCLVLAMRRVNRGRGFLALIGPGHISAKLGRSTVFFVGKRQDFWIETH